MQKALRRRLFVWKCVCRFDPLSIHVSLEIFNMPHSLDQGGLARHNTDMTDISEKFERDRKLSPFCTYQIGGLADYFFATHNVSEVEEAVDWALKNDVPFFVFGAGSNLLFDDAGFRGLVIRIKTEKILAMGEQIRADAGVKSSALVKAALMAGLTGLEAWNGLPGTVGGAVYGNAGCFGTEVKDVLESARVLIPGKGVQKVDMDWFEFGYRDSRLKRERGVVLEATFKLKKGDPEEIKANMMEIAKTRVGKQPPGLSTGSFFKNPADHPAGWLIDQCGLKGERHGNAAISEHHANFFMNKGGATAKEIIELGEIARDAVQKKFGIELEREIVYVPAES